MSPNAPASPKSAQKTIAPATTGKPSRLQRLNARLLRLQQTCENVAAEVAGYLAPLTEEERKSKTGVSLGNLSAEATRLAATSAELPKHAFRLHELKWEPATKKSSAFKPGDVVGLRDRRVERFTKNGAYTAAQVAQLEVISVHGDQAKMKIAGTKELLGLVPLSWLTAKNATAAQAA